MTFDRGATLTTATTLGHADTSNLGPTAGNGFFTRWPDDLALLQEIGLTDLRLTLDWSRLQPKPGALDLHWCEHFDNVLDAANAIGLRVWATLHDGAIPRWVDNEGGLADDRTVSKWWPRWVEPVADRFGAKVHGWIPFAGLAPDLPTQPWKDSWTILGGAEAPVVASLAAADASLIDAYLGTCDLIGVVLEHATTIDGPEANGQHPDDRDRDDPDTDELVDEPMRAALHQAADAASGTPVIITQFTPSHADLDVAALLVERLVATTDAVIDDGIDIGVVFVDPAIAGADSPIGLLDRDRTAQAAATAFLRHVDG